VGSQRDIGHWPYSLVGTSEMKIVACICSCTAPAKSDYVHVNFRFLTKRP
jgi:hypothetical protein